MKLTDIVSRHGFQVSNIANIKDAKLYTRINQDGVLEILCVQKIGNVMRVDRFACSWWCSETRRGRFRWPNNLKSSD